MLWDISGAQDAVYTLNLVVRAAHAVITLCELKREINKVSSNLNKQRILLYYQENSIGCMTLVIQVRANPKKLLP